MRPSSSCLPEWEKLLQSRHKKLREKSNFLNGLQLTGKDETLLVGRNAFLVLNLGLDVLNCVRGLHLERDRLSGEGLDEDLHPAAKTQNQMESRLFLDVVVREGASIFKLLA